MRHRADSDQLRIRVSIPFLLGSRTLNKSIGVKRPIGMWLHLRKLKLRGANLKLSFSLSLSRRSKPSR
jgi:hypothetical protein